MVDADGAAADAGGFGTCAEKHRKCAVNLRWTFFRSASTHVPGSYLMSPPSIT
jgi:hypothetical protein